jgi:hypothetical protein
MESYNRKQTYQTIHTSALLNILFCIFSIKLSNPVSLSCRQTHNSITHILADVFIIPLNLLSSHYSEDNNEICPNKIVLLAYYAITNHCEIGSLMQENIFQYSKLK